MNNTLARFEDFPIKSEKEIYLNEIKLVSNNRFMDEEEKKAKIRELKQIIENLK
ncbi:hypothetical protein [Pedobacter cryotolerans]|uniref:hypothetical protein n=1 Tax=Pedobacter cryotolerans TaxID=2571270 RepID=UPI00145D3A22|nr:hypothetical protein [Pedobacter cryotolerans]